MSDDALLAQHLRDRQHKVGRGDAFLQFAGQAEADDFRNEHRLRLAEHRGFGFDAADAPAKDSEAIDHRRVAVGTDEGIGIGDGCAVGHLVGPHGLRQIFEIDLMADAGAGRHDAEILEGALAPFQEVIALAVAGVFERDVVGKRFRRAELVDDDGMVDDEIDGHERIDLGRIAAELRHAVAHGGKIDDGRNAGEVLHQDAGRPKADFLFGLALVVEPFGHGDDVGFCDRTAVLVAQQVLEKNLHRIGKVRDAFEAVGLGIGQRIVNVRSCPRQ